MQINDGTLKKGEKAKVKVSGDGARMSRLTNFILVSFTILQQGARTERADLFIVCYRSAGTSVADLQTIYR